MQFSQENLNQIYFLCSRDVVYKNLIIHEDEEKSTVNLSKAWLDVFNHNMFDENGELFSSVADEVICPHMDSDKIIKEVTDEAMKLYDLVSSSHLTDADLAEIEPLCYRFVTALSIPF